MYLNRLSIMGFLGADGEKKSTAAGQTYTILSIATKTSWTDNQGDWQSHTEWHRVIVWGDGSPNTRPVSRKVPTFWWKAPCAAANTSKKTVMPSNAHAIDAPTERFGGFAGAAGSDAMVGRVSCVVTEPSANPPT